MANGNGAAGKVQPAITRESLFPEGWDQPKPEAADAADSEESTEDLAEAQVENEQEEIVSETPEAALGRMKLNEFLDAAGVTLEEFYRDVYVTQDGREVSVSAAWDEHKRLKEANDALLRERTELQEKANVAATQAPQPGISPEAQALAAQAQIYAQALTTTDWSQMDPAAAANQKLDLQMAIQQLQGQAQQKQMEHQQDIQKKMMEAKAEADRQTRAAIPEWADARVMQSDWQAVTDLMSAYGFSAQETALDSLPDPRVRRMMRDFAQAMGKQKRIAEGAKTVRKVSKTLGASARSAPTETKLTPAQVREKMAKAKKAGATREQLQKMRLTMEF